MSKKHTRADKAKKLAKIILDVFPRDDGTEWTKEELLKKLSGNIKMEWKSKVSVILQQFQQNPKKPQITNTEDKIKDLLQDLKRRIISPSRDSIDVKELEEFDNLDRVKADDKLYKQILS